MPEVPTENKNFVSNKVNKLDHQVICSAKIIDHNNNAYYTGYYMYPRSSISKTELMLSNHTGIIDSGYRGVLMGAFRWLKPENSEQDNYTIDRYTRLLQVCLPTLHPIFVVMVDESELTDTTRGTGGFGSTGV